MADHPILSDSRAASRRDSGSLTDKKAPVTRQPGFAGRMSWVTILYFAEGFPYGVFREVWSVYFRAAGVSLKEIGLMDLLGLPWTIKFLWAPLVDRYGDRRKWIAGCLVIMGALMAIHPVFDAGR